MKFRMMDGVLRILPAQNKPTTAEYMEDRVMKMECTNQTPKRPPYVWAEVNLSVIQENFRILQKFVSPAKVSAVLKANAYGLGLAPIGKALFEAGCRHFFVAYLDEADTLAEALRELGAEPAAEAGEHHYNLFVLDGPFLPHWGPEFESMGYTPVLNTLANVEEWDALGKSLGKRLPAVLHIDTGLCRLGMPRAEYQMFRERMLHGESFGGIDWRLFMSHPAASGQPDHPANALQFGHVQEIRHDFPDIPFAYADTCGILLGKEAHFDMVRIGIGLYGYDLSLPGIEHCLSVYGTVLQVQDVPAGQGIGYDWEFINDHPRRVATVSCGYADGITKNGARCGLSFTIRGQKAPILGRVSMDLTVVDITEIEGVQVGDRATILGEDAPVKHFIAGSGKSPYGILTGFSQRIQRFFEHSQPERGSSL